MTTPLTLARAFRAAFGLPLTRVWGSAETSGIAFVAPEEAPEGSLGRPLSGYVVRVVDDRGADVAAGDVGELAFAGPACIAGYWERVGYRPLKEPFVRVGDLVRQEADGSFTFIDRREGVMKVAGEKVYAAEVERALLAHPAVAEAAVVAAADDVRGEVPVAFVVPFPRVTLAG